MTASYRVGDTIQLLNEMPAASVDLILTSPPFLALRSYLPADHPDKHLEIGLEGSPGEYIDALLDVVEAASRVLAPHGSMCIELGDTYAESGGHGGDYAAGGMREGQPLFAGSARQSRRRDEAEVAPRVRDLPATGGDDWPLGKSLCLIPEIFRFALVYGFNPLTGRQTPRWRARNVIRWCRPNPSVGALADKVRPATSDMVVICQDRQRYFDLEAVRKPNPRADERAMGRRRDSVRPERESAQGVQNEGGAPPLDHWWHDDTFDQDAWLIPHAAYRGSHYATWPEQLLVIPIKSMCPQRVCTVCGKPSGRIVEPTEGYTEARGGSGDFSRHGRAAADLEEGRGAKGNDSGFAAEYRTVGWTDCGHDSWRPGMVLDPFAGSGTTLQVATGHGRDAIGFDIDEANAELALERVGPLMLNVEPHRRVEDVQITEPIL